MFEKWCKMINNQVFLPQKNDLWCYNDAVVHTLISVDNYHDYIVILDVLHLLDGTSGVAIHTQKRKLNGIWPPWLPQ